MKEGRVGKPPGLALWLDASDDLSTITHSSGAVSQWNDKSGPEGRRMWAPWDGWVAYFWIAEARAKPHLHPRRRCHTRAEARAARNMLNDGCPFVLYVVRRLDPPATVLATESAWLNPPSAPRKEPA